VLLNSVTDKDFSHNLHTFRT